MADTNPTWQGYAYTDLSTPTEIRLIELHPGDHSEEISCSISHHHLDTRPSYEALSYTWGGQSLTRTIYCSDASNIYEPLSVTPNCYAALQRLRRRRSGETRVLWIDAICINQNDVERSAQVALMPQIYRDAASVAVYVGEEADASQLVMQMARDRDEDALLRAGRPLVLQPWERAIVRAFISRPWFSRVWVLQEVFLSQEALLLCGADEVPWKKFAMLIFMRGPEIVGGGNMVGIPHVLSIDPWVKRKLPLLAVLQKTRFYECKDPRDKVFAVAGLVDSPPECLVPDYRKTAGMVYTEVAEFFLYDSGLLFLCCAQGRSGGSTLPSWVPDWSEPLSYYPSLSFSEEDMRWNDQKMAGGHPDLGHVRVLHDTTTDVPRCLRIRGLKLDSISRIGERCETIDWYWKDKIRTWLASTPSSDASRASSGASDLHDALVQVLFPTLHVESSKRVMKMVMEAHGSRSGGGIESSEGRYKSHVAGRRLVAVGDAYIGLGPLGARVGDVVVIFLGAKAPFVVRTVPVGGGYEIIGECILNDAMAGQAIERIDSDTVHATDAVAPLEDFFIY